MGNQKKWMQAVVLITLSFFNIAAHAQPINPWLADGLNRQIQQNRNNAQGSNQGPSAAEVRAWEQREAKIQARIAKAKATPWYMAIAYDFPNKKILGGGGYSTQQRAEEEAMKFCKSSNCKVALIFSNSCAVLTFPDRSIQSIDDMFFGIHPDHNQAAALSIKKCEAAHGKGNCLYSSSPTKHGTAFCTGYDYSVYGQH